MPEKLERRRFARLLETRDGRRVRRNAGGGRSLGGTRGGADRPGLWFSPHFYNTYTEADRALAAVREIRAWRVVTPV